MHSETPTLPASANKAYQPSPYPQNYPNGQMYPQREYSGQVFVTPPKTLCSIEVRSVLAAINAYSLGMLIIGVISSIVQRTANPLNMVFVSLYFLTILLILYALYENRHRVLLIVLNCIKAFGLLVLIALTVLIIIVGKKIIDDSRDEMSRRTYTLRFGEEDKQFEDVQDLGNTGKLTAWYAFLIVLLVIEIIFVAYEVYLMCRYVKYLRLRDNASKASYPVA